MIEFVGIVFELFLALYAYSMRANYLMVSSRPRPFIVHGYSFVIAIALIAAVAMAATPLWIR